MTKFPQLDKVVEEAAYELKCTSKYASVRLLRNRQTGEVVPLNCKSWRCPKHQKSWMHKWRVVVSRELSVNPVDRLITLTCASNATPEQLTLARQYFFRYWRKLNGQIEYFSVLEFTSETRLPHLHILARASYFQQRKISSIWRKSTKEAGIKPSPIVYVERPRSQEFSAYYALKYALSGTEKGQDIPKEWRGRKVSYSKHFFLAATVAEHWQAYIREQFGPPQPDQWEIMFDRTAFTNSQEYIDFAIKQGILRV